MEKSFAQQMLEKLSENVSQLILTVLILKEQNANIPVIEVTAIANAASSISDIAINLANSEYSNFTTVRNEIIEVSSKMSLIKKVTIDIISNFNVNSSNSDKQQSWNNLIQSCKNIANETYKIIQVIYDADIKCLKILKDNCTNEFKLNLESFGMIDREEFNEFGDRINQCVSSVIEYSNHVSSKVNEMKDTTIQPIESNELLLKQSEQLVEEANSLIDIVNDLFADTDDPSQKEKFIKLQDKIQQTIELTYNQIKENSPSLEIMDFTPKNQQFSNVSESSMQSPIQSKYSTSFINDAQHQIGNHQINLVHNGDTNNSLFNDLIKGISKSCIEELKATIRNDPIATETISNSINQLVPMLNDTINQYINNNNNNNNCNSEDIELLKKSISKLESELIPKYLEFGKLITKQGNTDELNSMVEQLDGIQDCLNSIGSIVSSKEDQFLNTIKAKENVLSILSDSDTPINNPAAIVNTLKHLAKNQTKLESMITENDPIEISDAVVKLSELLPMQIQAAKAYLKDSNNPESIKQLQDISKSMKLPLSNIISMMEPNKFTDSDEILSKEIVSTNDIINLCKQQQLSVTAKQQKLDSILKELEMGNATLVSIIQGELSLSEDPILSQLVKSTIDRLLEKVVKRRQFVLGTLINNSNDHSTIDQFNKISQSIADISKSLTDSLKSTETIPLLKIQLLENYKSGNLSKCNLILKDINNRINAITYNNNKSNPNIIELKSFQSQLNNQIQSIKQNQPNDTNQLNFIIDSIINNLNQLPITNNLINGSNDNNNNDDDEESTTNDDSTTTTNIPIELISEELESLLINENKEKERKRDLEKENEFKELEKLSSDQKLLTLFENLIQHIKNSEANKSMVTLKQLISEQDKLIQLANEIKENSASLEFKQQIDQSIQLFKSSVSLAISLAGKANLQVSAVTSGDQSPSPLSKATKTVKKSIIELTHLLKLNPSIEQLAQWENKMKSIGQSDFIGKLELYNQLIDNGDTLIKGFTQHQLNSRYYIQTAYEVDKDDLISDSIERIVYQQSELLRLAADYLVLSPTLESNIKLLLANSLNTVKKSISDQVVAALSFLDDKKQYPDESIEKLLIILDTVCDSVENCSKSIFSKHPQSSSSSSSSRHSKSSLPQSISNDNIKQSINSVLPSLTLAATKLQSNPQDKEIEKQYQTILSQVIDPLEALILNPNINQLIQDNNENTIDDTNSNDSNGSGDDELNKIKKLINVERIELDKLETSALESDSKGVVESSRVLVKLHQEILSISDNPDSDSTIKECSKELTMLIPQQLTTIKSMLQSKDMPTEASYQQKVGYINNQIKRNLMEIENQICKPSSNALKTPFYRDQFKKLSNQIEYNNNGGGNGNNEEFKSKLKKLESVAQQCIDSSQNELSKVWDKNKQSRIRDAIDELEKRLNKNQPNDLSSKISQYSKQPSNPSSREQFEKARNFFENQLDKVIEETSTTSQELLTNHLNLISKLSNYSTRQQNGNGSASAAKVQEVSKQILSNYSKLKQQLNADLQQNQPLYGSSVVAAAEKKSIILASLKEIESITPSLILASTNCHQDNSGDQKKRELLECLTTKIESPISQILHQLDPIDPVYNFDHIVKLHQATITELNDAIKYGMVEQVNQLITKLSSIQKNDLLPFIKSSSSSSSTSSAPEFESQLKSKLNDVVTISTDYLKHLKTGTLTENIVAEKEMAISSLRNLVNSIQSLKLPELEEKRDRIAQSSSSKSKNLQLLVASIKSNNLLPIIDSPNKIEKYVSIQTNTSKPIFSKVVSTASVNIKPRSNSAAKPAITPKPTVVVKTPVPVQPTRPAIKLSSPNPPPTTTTTKSTPTPVVATTSGNSLENSVLNAVSEILTSGNSIENRQVGDIANELKIYAAAINSNDKKSMLVCSRNISTLINKYTDEMTTIAKSSTNKFLSSKMNSINILKTLSFQFKILTSVKAASSDSDTDSDSQLSSLVKLLTSTMCDINTTVSTINKLKK